MAAKPTKTTAARPAKEAAPTTVADPNGDAPAKRKYTKKPTPTQFEVYFEDEAGALAPMGSFKGSKPTEALETYFNSLEAEDQAGALEAVTYVVNTPKGLVKLALSQKLDIVAR